MKVCDLQFIDSSNAALLGDYGASFVGDNTLCFYNLHGCRADELNEILNYKSWILRSWKTGRERKYFVNKYGVSNDGFVIWSYAGFAPILIRHLQNRLGYLINGKELFRPREITLGNMYYSLWDFQLDAVKTWEDAGGYGIIKCPTGAGKSIIGCAIIKKLGVRTIICVHTGDLLINVWYNYLIEQFGASIKSRLGIIGGGLSKRDRKEMRICGGDFGENIKKDIVIATAQSLLNRLQEVGKEKFGLLIYDEIHHAPAENFRKVVNAIRATNRLGLSVTGDTYILTVTEHVIKHKRSTGVKLLSDYLFDGEERKSKEYKVIRLDELYSIYNNDIYNKEKNEIIDISNLGIKTLSFNGNDTCESKITHVHRYNCDKKVYEIKTYSGRSIKVTEDHSLFKLDNEYSIMSVKSSELKTGDYLAIPKKIGVLDNKESDNISILELLGRMKTINQSADSSYSSIYVQNINDDVFKYIEDVRRGEFISHMSNKYETFKISKGEKAELWKYRYMLMKDERSNFKYWKTNKVIPVEIFYDMKLKYDEFMYIGGLKDNIKLSINIEGDKYKDLMYILGFFAADGWIAIGNNKMMGVGFSCGYHKVLIDKLILKIKNVLECELRIFNDDKKNTVLMADSVCFAKLLEEIGVYSYDKDDDEKVKVVPSMVFSSSIESRKSFIEGLIDGDGHLDKKNMVFITNTSKKLIYGTLLLINSIGYVGNLNKRKPRKGGVIDGRQIEGKRDSYQLYFDNRLCNDIYGNMNEIKEKLDIENENLDDMEDHIGRRELQKIQMLPLMDSLKNLISRIEDRRGRHTSNMLLTSKNNYMKRERLSYDDLIVIMNRLSSNMAINFKHHILNLYKSEICFDEIKSIDCVDNTEYVYDISVDVKTQNFIGNNIYCHNSASLIRPDGMSPMMQGLIGDVVYRIGIKDLVRRGLLVEPLFNTIIIDDEECTGKISESKKGTMEHARFVKRVSSTSEKKKDYITELCSSLVLNKKKFMLYTDWVNGSDEGVYTRDDYVRMLRELGIKAIGVTSEMSSKEREEVFKYLKESRIDGIVFGSLGSEGINIPVIDSVIMCNATASTIRFPQRTGRAMRTSSGKRNCFVYEILLNTEKELEWSRINFYEYETEGYKKNKIWIKDGKVVRTEIGL